MFAWCNRNMICGLWKETTRQNAPDGVEDTTAKDWKTWLVDWCQQARKAFENGYNLHDDKTPLWALRKEWIWFLRMTLFPELSSVFESSAFSGLMWYMTFWKKRGMYSQQGGTLKVFYITKDLLGIFMEHFFVVFL